MDMHSYRKNFVLYFTVLLPLHTNSLNFGVRAAEDNIMNSVIHNQLG